MAARWRPPDKRRAGPPDRAGSSGSSVATNDADYTDNYDDLQSFVTLGDAAHMALAALWWRMRRDGVRLPANVES